MGGQRGGEQRLRVRMARLGGDRLGRTVLDDLAQVHDGDRVAHVGHRGEVVGDEEVRQPEVALQVGEQVQDLRADRHVERRHRLVQHHQARRERQRAGDGDALALAARELVGEQLGGALRQADEVEQLRHALADRGGGEGLVGDQRLGHDLAHAHAGIERGERVLEDGLHGAAVAAQPLRAQTRERLAVEANLAPGRLLELQDELGGRGLAAAGLAHHAQRATRVDRERHAVHGAHGALDAGKQSAPKREVLREVSRFDHRRVPLRQGRVDSGRGREPREWAHGLSSPGMRERLERFWLHRLP